MISHFNLELLEMISYGFTKSMNVPFDRAVEKVRECLQNEGFGILTRIDVHDTLHEKLGIDIPRYVILGACNPRNAHRAIMAEQNIGLMLPCNVIVYEVGNKVQVGIIKPSVAMKMIRNSDLREIADEVEDKLRKVFESL